MRRKFIGRTVGIAALAGASAAYVYAAASLALLPLGEQERDLSDRIAQVYGTGCRTDAECERAAREAGVSPLYMNAPYEVLADMCGRRDDTACRYRDAIDRLEARHRAACAADGEHDDCAAFRD